MCKNIEKATVTLGLKFDFMKMKLAILKVCSATEVAWKFMKMNFKKHYVYK